MLTGPRQLTFTEHRMRTGRGGPRPGAGRKPGPRARVLHRARLPVPVRCPVHVTVRMRPDVPSLRSGRLVRAFRRSLAEACERGEFRVVHYSLQRDHAHLLVEAHGKAALARGMKSVGARLARTANRVFRRRGGVLDGRYHARILRTPREVRRALAYVLLNARRHFAKRFGSAPAAARLDPASSARWFDGWQWTPGSTLGRACREEPREVARPRTWLLAVGWRRWGLVSPSETTASFAFERRARLGNVPRSSAALARAGIASSSQRVEAGPRIATQRARHSTSVEPRAAVRKSSSHSRSLKGAEAVDCLE
jgi:REP element-mobilizing transposase RayT